MFCGKCGSDMKDNAKFCPKCGAPVPGFEMSNAGNEARDNKAVKPRGKIMSKKTKAAIIISAACVAAAAAVVSCILLLGGRTKDKAVEKFETAFNAQEDDKLLKLMYPKKMQDEADELAYDGIIPDLVSWNEELKDDAGEISVKLKDTQKIDEYDEELRNDIETELLSKLDIQYSDIVVANLEVSFDDKADEDKLGSVVMYKIDKTWYILPGAIELVIDDRKATDIENANTIKTMLEMCMAAEDVYYSLEPYRDVVVALDELDYMPQVFQEKFMEYVDEAGGIPGIRHKGDGAVGYAFMIDGSDNVSVYISSDESMNEWEAAPRLSDRYDNGERSSRSNMAAPGEYSYVKLISEKSPILGYWQADNAGLYVGYNVSGGDEGLTVYNTEGETILHAYSGYDVSGSNGTLKYEPEPNREWCTVTYTINVLDDSNIEMICSDYESGEDISYIYTRGEITDDELSQYVGTWVAAYEDLNFNTGTLELIHCDTCGFLHSANGSCVSDDEYVCIYNGSKIMYIFPDEGLYYVEGGVGYNLTCYILDGDKLTDDSARHGGGGGVTLSYYREGSSQAEISAVLAAYQEYVYDIDSIIGYNMADIDGDGVPECVVYNDEWDGSGGGYARVLTYKNGQVYSCENNYTTTSIYIKSGSNDFCMKYYGRMELEGLTIYGISDDGFFEKENCGSLFYDIEERYSYQINGEETDSDTYSSYWNSFESYDIPLDADYSSITDAYAAYSGN